MYLGLETYQGTVHGPDVGLRAAPAPCDKLSCSATAVDLVCCRILVGCAPVPHSLTHKHIGKRRRHQVYIMHVLTGDFCVSTEGTNVFADLNIHTACGSICLYV